MPDVSATVRTLRGNAERYLPDRCTIYRKTTQNVGGEEVEDWDVLAEDVPCSIAPVGGGESGVVGGRVAEETTHLLRLPAEQDIEEPDRVALDDIAYDVTQVHKRGSWETIRPVEIKESVEGIPEVGS